MQTETDKLVILVTKGIDSELSSVAFTIANGGLTAGLKVSMFLTSTAIDLVRRGGQQLTHVAPLQPLAALIEDFQKRGGVIWACPPCVQSRGYQQADLLDGVIIVGASAMHAEIKQGAATLSFLSRRRRWRSSPVRHQHLPHGGHVLQPVEALVELVEADALAHHAVDRQLALLVERDEARDVAHRHAASHVAALDGLLLARPARSA